MKKFNYYYYSQPITKQQFLSNVPVDWQNDLNEYGVYSFGGYKAIQLDND